MLRWMFAVIPLPLVLACGGNAAPPAPTPTPAPVPTDNWVITGRVVAYGSSTPVSRARVAPLSGSAATTDSTGAFRLSSTTAPSSQPIAVTVDAEGYVTREMFLRYQAGTRGDVTLTLIRETAPFSLGFFKALVRNEFEGPGNLRPVLRLVTSPKVYVRTVDQRGRMIEKEVLEVVLPAIRKAVSDWSGGVLSVTTLETSTETRPRTEGWIVVNIIRDYTIDYCARTYVGATDGQVTLVDDRCRCGSNKISGEIVAHEIGHALGFFHVNDPRALMYPYAAGNCPAGTLSADERYHSTLAYTRPRGNMDPDRDPPSGALLTAPAEGSGEATEVIN